MTLKEMIKKTRLGKIGSRIRAVQYSRRILKYDEALFLKQLYDNFPETKRKHMEREILISSHIVEKGLSHQHIKPLFGKENIKKLKQLVSRYEALPDKDDYIYHMGKAALEAYQETYREMNIDTKSLLGEMEKNSSGSQECGAADITGKEFFSCADKDFYQFAHGRRSLRLFDFESRNVPQELLKQAAELAMTAPSACNRQSSRIYFIRDKMKMKQICDIQGGCVGFGENADVLAVITNDLSLYSGGERRLPLIDGGIFTMNFMYALHYFRLGGCILNVAFTPEKEKMVKSMTGIGAQESITAVIPIVRIREEDLVRVPKAERRSAESICYWR